MAEEVKMLRPDALILFAGTRGKIEERVVPAKGYPFVPIWISGLQRRLSPGNLLFPLKLVVSVVQSVVLLRRYRASVVVGTGGYVSGPVVFAASLLGIPTVIQEQNSYPGVTTRLLASRVDEVHLSFEKSMQYLKRRDRVHLTGNPTRSAVGTVSKADGRTFFGLDADRPTLLVFGGSLGAHSINAALMQCAGDLSRAGIQIIWQTGDTDFEAVSACIGTTGGQGTGKIVVRKFIEQMEYALGACDLAVCRSGATTLAELTRARVPSVLVPYPHAAADHQTENARAMAEAGASLLITDGEAAERLPGIVRELMADPATLARMSQHAAGLSRPDAGKQLARAIIRLAGAQNEH
jgi:UDP-N-acetylglucosamine--N-acetylmuramyl-(pentapeptide) pyrophosphoryl-undecaprenol N-acetylglucosamine transferase